MSIPSEIEILTRFLASKPTKSFALSLALILLLSLYQGAGARLLDDPNYATDPFFAETIVFQAGTDGYFLFRIPTIIRTPSNSLLAFCEARLESGADRGNKDVVLKQSTDEGKTWSAVQIVVDHKTFASRWTGLYIAVGNMTPVVDQFNDTIWLLFSVDANDGQTHAITVWVTHSSDSGVTWTIPTEITSEVMVSAWDEHFEGPVHAIQLANGRLLVPSYHRITSTPFHHSHVIYSDDHGATWKLGGVVYGLYTNEATLVQLLDGRILMSMRSSSTTNLQRPFALSTDFGERWSTIRVAPDIPESFCQASMIRFSDQFSQDHNLLLFSSPAGPDRTNMLIRLSYDEGQTWPIGKSVYPGKVAYSDLVMLPDSTVGLLYEKDWQSQSTFKLVFARFNLVWLTD